MERKVLPLTDEEKLEYCNMYFDCMDCTDCMDYCPMTDKNLSDEQIEGIRMILIKGKEIK